MNGFRIIKAISSVQKRCLSTVLQQNVYHGQTDLSLKKVSSQKEFKAKVNIANIILQLHLGY
jgi:hypothetical protein